MTEAELKEIILGCINDVVFRYNGKASGITSEVHDYVPTFQAWHGEDYKHYSDIDALMTDKFYSGKSLVELIATADFTVL